MCFGVNCRFSFQVLRWFYQLAGLLLSMSSPLEYLDGFNPATLPALFTLFDSCIQVLQYSFRSCLSFSAPSLPQTALRLSAIQVRHTQVYVVMQTLLHMSIKHEQLDIDVCFSDSSDEQAKFSFCVDKNTTPATIFGANIVFYAFWGLIMIAVSHPCIWSVLRIVIYKMKPTPDTKDAAKTLLTDSASPELQLSSALQVPPIVECRGRLFLDFAITVRLVFAFPRNA